MASIKMDELLVSWLGSDDVYEKVLTLIERNRSNSPSSIGNSNGNKTRTYTTGTFSGTNNKDEEKEYDPDPNNENNSNNSLRKDSKSSKDANVPGPSSISSPLRQGKHRTKEEIPPFYYPNQHGRRRGNKSLSSSYQSWDSIEPKVQSIIFSIQNSENPNNLNPDSDNNIPPPTILPDSPLPMDQFHKITKEICGFPRFFNGPFYRRILYFFQLQWQAKHKKEQNQQPIFPEEVSYQMFQEYWREELEMYDTSERFFRLVKHPDSDYISKDDFLPYIEELLASHPGLEFLSNHAEFQEKYAITVITRIFYSVNTCHNGKITCRQIRKSDLIESFHAVDAEEDINKITRYFSYEHFYVLYCRFWELDHDRDYRITRDDLLKYGEHSLSHMVVDRIFDAAPRPFLYNSKNNNNEGNNSNDNGHENQTNRNNDESNHTQLQTLPENNNSNNNSREYLSYEDFIFFMLSEEDKANEISVRYWFSCIDVDGDGKLNNMEMRSFYAVQLHRMQCLGHDTVPFEDMLCQMIDMIKPKSQDFIVVEDFLQPECSQVSGALFDALFNLNKYLQFEQRDPFMERQKREDEFQSDWDRFAYIDYNRLAMEEEAREEEAMEIDWVSVDDDDDDDDGDDFNSLGLGGASEAPF